MRIASDQLIVLAATVVLNHLGYGGSQDQVETRGGEGG